MNNKVCLFLLFVFLILMLLFYYLNLESNVVILLGVIIVLLLNDLIMKREHFFNTNENLDGILKNVQGTLDNLTKLKATSENTDTEEFPSLIVNSSCAPAPSVSDISVDDRSSENSQPKPTGRTGIIPNLDEDGYKVYADTLESLAGLD